MYAASNPCNTLWPNDTLLLSKSLSLPEYNKKQRSKNPKPKHQQKLIGRRCMFSVALAHYCHPYIIKLYVVAVPSRNGKLYIWLAYIEVILRCVLFISTCNGLRVLLSHCVCLWGSAQNM